MKIKWAFKRQISPELVVRMYTVWFMFIKKDNILDKFYAVAKAKINLCFNRSPK